MATQSCTNRIFAVASAGYAFNALFFSKLYHQSFIAEPFSGYILLR